jgi:hypothetical protein
MDPKVDCLLASWWPLFSTTSGRRPSSIRTRCSSARSRKTLTRISALVLLAPLLAQAESKFLTDADKIEILRGLDAEYAKAKVFLPRSKKPLPFESTGQWNAAKWQSMGKEDGPAARVGDQVQITSISFGGDRIVLELNHGFKRGGHWYDHVQAGMGGVATPLGGGGTAAAGTYLAIEFPGKIPSLQTAELKKILAPVLDFDKHSASLTYSETLPPAIKTAIKNKKAVEGMDRDQVLLSMGKPRTKDRQTRDGVDLEDWIYGAPPGTITFVTFANSKVVKVKEEYAGLGGSTVPDLPAR